MNIFIGLCIAVYVLQIFVLICVLFTQLIDERDCKENWVITTKKDLILNFIPCYFIVHIYNIGKVCWEKFDD